MPTKEELKMLQSLPLDIKVAKTLQRVREWVQHYGENGVYVSFSGGKDSTVLLHLVRSIYPNVKAVFSDTGLEFPEIRNFVKTFDNVDWVKPKITFGEIVTKFGYPLFGKEVSNTIWYARKIRGGGSTYYLRKRILGLRRDNFMSIGNGSLENTTEQSNPFVESKRLKGTSQFTTKKNTCPLANNFPSLFQLIVVG